jgi:hypothetical protein
LFVLLFGVSHLAKPKLISECQRLRAASGPANPRRHQKAENILVPVHGPDSLKSTGRIRSGPGAGPAPVHGPAWSRSKRRHRSPAVLRCRVLGHCVVASIVSSDLLLRRQLEFTFFINLFHLLSCNFSVTWFFIRSNC